jgi:hypothetical protein
MGKKSKKIKNIWDLTPEEQQQNLDDFAAFEEGEVTVMSLLGNKYQPGLSKTGFSKGLEDVIVRDQKKIHGYNDEKETVVDTGSWLEEQITGKKKDKDQKSFRDLATKSGLKPSKPSSGEIDIDEPVKADKPKTTVFVVPTSSARKQQILNVSDVDAEPEEEDVDVDTPSEDIIEEPDAIIEEDEEIKSSTYTLDDVRCLSFKNGVGHITINDGIAPTTVSLEYISKGEVVPNLDADQAGEICVELMNYITSLKHPTAIYKTDEFYNEEIWKFASVKNGTYNTSKFIFFEDDEYVFAYVIDTKSIEEFQQIINSQYPEKILDVYINMAYAAGQLNQAFFAGDSKYVYNCYHNEEFNKQKEFHRLFIEDESTVICDEGNSTNDDCVETYDLPELQANARETIKYLTGDITEEEYADFNSDTEDEDDEEDSEDFSDLMDGTDEDVKFEDSESSDEVKTVTEMPDSNEADSDDDFVLPVIRKNS